MSMSEISLHSNQYFIKEVAGFISGSFSIENKEHQELYFAVKKVGFISTKINVFNDNKQEKIEFSVVQNNAIFKKSYSLKDSKGITFAKIYLSVLEWRIMELQADHEYKVQIETVMNIVTKNTRISKLKVSCENILVADFKYCDLSTSTIDFYDKEDFQLDRRIGIALALIV